jgi:fructose-1-phosphate kinase PfkB-like protein
VCRVLKQLGKDVCHLTQLGGALRHLFLELCGRDNLRVEWVESHSPIRFCYTLIDRGQKTTTELVEESEEVGEGTEKRLLKKFLLLLPECSSFIISGSKAAGFSEALIPEMVSAAKTQKRRVILDIRGQDLLKSLSSKPDIIKPNLEEFTATFNIDSSKEKVKKICAELYEEYRCTVILTRGSDPVWYAEKGKLEEYGFKKLQSLNPTGSGDAFTAGLAAALEEGASLFDAVAEGVRCGALNAALLRPGVIF